MLWQNDNIKGVSKLTIEMCHDNVTWNVHSNPKSMQYVMVIWQIKQK